MIEAIEGNSEGPEYILSELRKRRDAAVKGLNAINGITIAAPTSTFYLFPNVSAIMERKGFTDVNQLMDEALTETSVSFCTRKHFGRSRENEIGNYLRFAYSGIDVNDINKGMEKLKLYFEN